ncbi:hypothetical protein A0H81_14384 [Grifola frondosa]|uniref:Uncharacterized protein n=1 Tax=Grifola frondosa TaxID=5627 RepID=A0A1C7LLM5_GRIFR|nr:hypothetical protein A0H81_14384 [Grifola frondosa]
MAQVLTFPQVCTKIVSFLEQDQRLENLNWRPWHPQDLMVNTDSARSKHDFKKLSKCMRDKLDKETGQNIELQAVGFRCNHSTELLQQRILKKEAQTPRRARMAGTALSITCSSLATSTSPPVSPPFPSPKPDLHPSPEFKDNAIKHGQPVTSPIIVENAPTAAIADKDADKDPRLPNAAASCSPPPITDPSPPMTCIPLHLRMASASPPHHGAHA